MKSVWKRFTVDDGGMTVRKLAEESLVFCQQN